ncbi:MAG: cytochrome c oxidase accessory protein CcoG [Gammaproteobacteria bacterium]
MEQALYAKREKIYPREVHGLFAGLRVTAVIALLGIFYGLPWVTWDGRQAVLLDLPARKFYIFGLTFWPQDFLLLAFLLIIAGLSLFFFTALAGRLWCGYACPQTVWTEVFLWMERMIEGDRQKQIKLDKAPWSLRKFRIKTTKHTVWILFSAFTGFTFVAFFTPAVELAGKTASFSLGPWETFWMIFYGFATYGNAGWMREQVCLYMCPYARFQSAMFDDDTLIVSYDEKRGEPRGPRRAGIDHRAKGLGDCINCTLCVQVCPTGIDIRDGLQYECISCSACIDACNDVMDKMNYPRGLIRYTTQNALEGRKTRLLRPRILVYGIVLLAFMILFAWLIATRIPLDLDVIRDRNQLYRETQGLIENVYTLKILNMEETPHEYRVTADGIEGMELTADSNPVTVRAGEVLDVPVRIRVNEGNLEKRSSGITFTITNVIDPERTVSEDAVFLGPLP